MPVLFAEALLHDSRYIQVAALPHTLQVDSRVLAGMLLSWMQVSSKAFELIEEAPTASAPWPMSLNLLKSKPGTASSALGPAEGSVESTIVSSCPTSAHHHPL